MQLAEKVESFRGEASGIQSSVAANNAAVEKAQRHIAALNLLVTGKSTKAPTHAELSDGYTSPSLVADLQRIESAMQVGAAQADRNFAACYSKGAGQGLQAAITNLQLGATATGEQVKAVDEKAENALRTHNNLNWHLPSYTPYVLSAVIALTGALAWAAYEGYIGSAEGRAV